MIGNINRGNRGDIGRVNSSFSPKSSSEIKEKVLSVFHKLSEFFSAINKKFMSLVDYLTEEGEETLNELEEYSKKDNKLYKGIKNKFNSLINRRRSRVDGIKSGMKKYIENFNTALRNGIDLIDSSF